MSVMNDSKSTLGKLLAAENIRIEHRKVRGPFFDVKERLLVLPIWKGMSADLYDLMIGHEVGHALFTPTDGWLDKVKELDGFKTFLNLVEDARIEKKMKRKYPGLVKPMYNGYTELVERNFFGCTFDEMNQLPFADRLNCYFKLGIRANVSFNEKEQDLVNRIEEAESWDDVMTLAKELYDVSEDERQSMEDAFSDLEGDDYSSSSSPSDSSDLSDQELSDMMDNIEDSLNRGNPQSAGTSSSKPSQNTRSVQQTANRLRKEGKEELAKRLESLSERMLEKMRDWAENSPSSMTADSIERNSENTLIDESAYPTTYMKWPKLNPKHFVIPHKITHATMLFEEHILSRRDELYTEYMNTNKNYISYLVKEFELRRNAKQFAKAHVSKTGSLDMNKIWQYKLSEDLFLQNTIVPDGKNHGMLMVMDMSSSMTDNMRGTIEQTIALAMFCRRVNIPFEVYGFVDNSDTADEFRMAGIPESRNDTSYRAMQLMDSTFRLKQFFTHTMSLSEFNSAVKNMLMYASTFKYSYGWYNTGVSNNMALGGTPLNETILVLRYIAEEFRKNTHVEILNTIVLTDGEASYGTSYMNEEGKIDTGRYNVVVEDHSSPRSVRRGYDMTESLLALYREITGSRTIGMYIMSGRNHKRTISFKFRHCGLTFDQMEAQYKNQFNKHKYFGLPTTGYDMSYAIPGDELKIEEVSMEETLKNMKVSGKQALYKAFKKTQNTKHVSRVFLNQFILNVA